jgi:asparagine synthase (glutamine-hydrolysing)
MNAVAGLLCFVSARGDAAAHHAAVSAGLSRLRHRAAGGGRVEIQATADVVFGAVSGLEGPQPLAFPADGARPGRYLVVFDGAVYNGAQLRAELAEEVYYDLGELRTDGEVVAAAYHHWGPSAVNRLRGMFAFVIWDTAARRAFGARDPFGIKPLYELSTPDGVYFASERKALPHGLELDEAALQQYLTLRYVPEPATMDRGVTRLGAGESFVYTPGGPVVNRRYAQLSFAPAADVPVEKIRDVLRDSVRAHVDGLDEVGVLLSSGVDSAAVLALAAAEHAGIRAYTVGYENQPSELDVAASIARPLGVPWSGAMVTPADVVAALPLIMWHLDDPLADPTVIPTWFAVACAAREVPVVLSGDGADELFGGYGIYREPLSLSTVRHLPDPMQRGLRALSHVIPQGVKGKSFIERGTTPIEERYYGNARVFTEEEKAQLLRHYEPGVRHTAVTGPVYAEAHGLDEVTTMQHVDLSTSLRGSVLVKADRLAMAHGVQLRLPYLDRAVFDVAAALPVELKVPHRSAETKVALRRAVAGLVPDEIAQRKLAFPPPIRAWLKAELHDWAAELIDSSETGELLDLDVVRRLLEAHRKKDADHSRQLWAILMFCLWHGIFVAGTIEAGPAGQPPGQPPV